MRQLVSFIPVAASAPVVVAYLFLVRSMLLSTIQTRIWRDVRLALGIHAVFLTIFIGRLSSWDVPAYLALPIFLPHLIAFSAVGVPDSKLLSDLLSFRLLLGLLAAFPISLIYAAGWHSLVYFVTMLRDHLRLRWRRET